MPVTDAVELTRLAAATILNADTTLRTIMGRTTQLVREPYAWAADTTLEVPVVILSLTLDEGRGEGVMRLAAIAEDTGAVSATQQCHLMLERAVAALTCTAFQGQSVSLVPGPAVEAEVSLENVLGMSIENMPSLRVVGRDFTYLLFT